MATHLGRNGLTRWCICINPSRPNPGRREKIKLIFYFHTSLWCLKRFYEVLKGFHKTFCGTTKKCENKNLTWFLFQYIFHKCTGRQGLLLQDIWNNIASYNLMLRPMSHIAQYDLNMIRKKNRALSFNFASSETVLLIPYWPLWFYIASCKITLRLIS